MSTRGAQGGSHRARAEDTTCERAGEYGVSLGEWLALSWEDSIQLAALEGLDLLRIRTRNSTYDVAILDPATGEVLVRGGRYFPDWTHGRLVGCSFGRGLLRCRTVRVGMRLELCAGGRHVITSTVLAAGQCRA